jgi:hypothetical protein
LDRVIKPILLGPVITSFNLNADQSDKLRAALRPVAEATPIAKTPPATALDSLVKYVPTESVTLYVAATAALSSVTPSAALGPERIYWGFVVLTPTLFILIYMGKRRSQKLPLLPKAVAQWPWWKLIASTIAFGVWALAVPPLLSTDLGKVASAFGALLVSTLLSLIGAVIEPPEPDAPAA